MIRRELPRLGCGASCLLREARGTGFCDVTRSETRQLSTCESHSQRPCSFCLVQQAWIFVYSSKWLERTTFSKFLRALHLVSELGVELDSADFLSVLGFIPSIVCRPRSQRVAKTITKQNRMQIDLHMYTFRPKSEARRLL